MTYAEGITLDSPFYEFSRHASDIAPWDKIGISTLAIPVVRPGLDPLCNALTAWMDEEVESDSNLAVLADYGVNMDHPCVRAFTKEEVDANRKFLVASAKTLRAFEFFKVCFITISIILNLMFSHSVWKE